jgi:hypothetical protein
MSTTSADNIAAGRSEIHSGSMHLRSAIRQATTRSRGRPAHPVSESVDYVSPFMVLRCPTLSEIEISPRLGPIYTPNTTEKKWHSKRTPNR